MVRTVREQIKKTRNAIKQTTYVVVLQLEEPRPILQLSNLTTNTHLLIFSFLLYLRGEDGEKGLRGVSGVVRERERAIKKSKKKMLF